MTAEDAGPDPATGLAMARVFGDAGNHRSAAGILREVLARHPGDVDALSLLGLYLDYLGDAAGAVRSAQTAVALKPEDADTHRLLGIVLSRRRQTSKRALEHLETAVRLAPENGHNHYQLALQHFRMYRPRRGRRALADACARGPADPVILAGAADLLFAVGRPREAMALAARAFAADPDSTMALAAEARSRLIRGRPGEALDLARAAVQINPHHMPALGALAEAELCRWRLFAIWSKAMGWAKRRRWRAALAGYLAVTLYLGLLAQALDRAGPFGAVAVGLAGVLVCAWVMLSPLALRRAIDRLRRPVHLHRDF